MRSEFFLQLIEVGLPKVDAKHLSELLLSNRFAELSDCADHVRRLRSAPPVDLAVSIQEVLAGSVIEKKLSFMSGKVGRLLIGTEASG